MAEPYDDENYEIDNIYHYVYFFEARIMLKIDESEFPIVWLTQIENIENKPSQADDADDSFIQLEKILDKRSPFIIINTAEFGDKNRHEHSKDEKMKIVLWLKKNKKNVKKYIIAQIQIVPKEKQGLLLNSFVKTFSKFWGYPMIIVSNKEQALEKAKSLLEKTQ
ncbi:hypothetical protein WCU84_19385 [Dickeya chrysanthemi]|uniref:Uncharacterized protein n=1 Tax=Dickeya chrysanthemi TaxID=556 RepID=A0ABU8JTJ6_DICCH